MTAVGKNTEAVSVKALAQSTEERETRIVLSTPSKVVSSPPFPPFGVASSPLVSRLLLGVGRPTYQLYRPTDVPHHEATAANASHLPAVTWLLIIFQVSHEVNLYMNTIQRVQAGGLAFYRIHWGGWMILQYSIVKVYFFLSNEFHCTFLIPMNIWPYYGY